MLQYILFLIYLLPMSKSLPPLCNHCECTRDREDYFEVVCTANTTPLFDASLWVSSNQSLYSYKSLTVENASFPIIDKKFPESKVTLLDLSHNCIEKIEGCVFSNLETIEILILSHNNLQSLQCLKLKTLRNLHLDHNRITTMGDAVFENMDLLEVLDLSHNPLPPDMDDNIYKAIAKLPHLKVLDLSYTTLKSLPHKVMRGLKELSVLDLSGNYFTQLPKTLQHSRSLTYLYFNNNPLEALTDEHNMKTLPYLQSFHMSSNPALQYISNGALSPFPNLEEIYITNNSALYNIGKRAFCSYYQKGKMWKCPSIKMKKLILQNNGLETLNKLLINDWNQLSHLDLTNNQWSCSCENQWIIDDLMPIYLKLDAAKAKTLKCASPPQMASYALFELFEDKIELECFDPLYTVWSWIPNLYPYDVIITAVLVIYLSARTFNQFKLFSYQ